MCCFSAPVREVSGTRIFARTPAPGRQYLAYQMTYAADVPVAMILPLPVRLPARETGTVRFIDLRDYPRLFIDLEILCAGGLSRGAAGGIAPPDVGAARPLPVVEVGDYVASFVPAVSDFERLDPRFSLPPQVWAAIPAYHDYRFAVFQLRASAAGRRREVHPMALEFETRLPPRTVFFPTVHIHDGRVRPVEKFDHTLYLQYPAPPGGGPPPRLTGVPPRYQEMETSHVTASAWVNTPRTKGVVAAAEPVGFLRLRGRLHNRDVVATYDV